MSVRRSASAAGLSFCSMSFLAMNASTGFLIQEALAAPSVTAGTAGRTGFWKDHQVWAGAGPPDTLLGQAAPCPIHFATVSISASGSFGPGGIERSPVLR